MASRQTYADMHLGWGTTAGGGEPPTPRRMQRAWLLSERGRSSERGNLQGQMYLSPWY